MVNPTNPLEKPKSPEFLDTSDRLEQAYQKALEAERDSDVDLGDYLNETFLHHDTASTDCHTFTAHILNFEYGIPNVVPPQFPIPKREDYEWEATWLEALQKAASDASRSQEYQQYLEDFAQFQERLFSYSEQYDLPTFDAFDTEEQLEAKNFGSELASEIANVITATTIARTMLISGSGTGRFVDLHTMTILGPTQDGNDVWILDKEQIGSKVHVTKLSEIITTYCLNQSYEKHNMILSLCFKSAKDIYTEDD